MLPDAFINGSDNRQGTPSAGQAKDEMQGTSCDDDENDAEEFSFQYILVHRLTSVEYLATRSQNPRATVCDGHSARKL